MPNRRPKSVLRSTVVESLESRRLLSATPSVMAYLVDYKIGNGNTGVVENGSGVITTDNLDWADLKQVNYFSLEPQVSPAYSSGGTTSQGTTSDGSLQAATSSGYDPTVQLPQLVADAGRHGVSVFATLGGGDPGSIYDMDALVNSPSAYATFAANIANFCNTYGLAGVDLDWEPTAQGGFTVTAAQIENFGNLIKAIKTDDPNLALSADTLGDPVAVSTAGGSSTGNSAFMLNAVAVQYLDTINVEAYPVTSQSEGDTIIQNWKAYVTGGQDIDGVAVNAPVGKLQYGLDVDDDTSNQPAGVIENKVDLTFNQGLGGLFLWEGGGTYANTALARIGAEISTDAAANSAAATVSLTGSPSANGAILSATVTLPAGDPAPTGAVTFLDDGTAIGTANLSAGVATFDTAALSAGTHIFTASYPANSTSAPFYSAGLSNAYTQIVSSAVGQASATLVFTSIDAAYDGNAHAEPGTATGSNGEDLSALLSYSYRSAADGSVSTTAPTQPGTYEVFAGFAGNATYAAVASADTGDIVLIGPESALQSVPSAKLPSATLIAGGKIKPIKISVKLLNSADTIATGTTAVSLTLSTSPTGSAGDAVVGNVSKGVKIKANKSGAFGVFTVRALPAGLSGTVYLILKLTDANGATNIASVGSINATAAFNDLAAVAVTSPAKARRGGKIAATVTLMQNGNLPISGKVPVELFLSTDGQMTGAIDLGTAEAHVSIQPGKKANLHLKASISSAVPANAYYVIAQLDPANTLSDTNLANNIVTSLKTVAVA